MIWEIFQTIHIAKDTKIRNSLLRKSALEKKLSVAGQPFVEEILGVWLISQSTISVEAKNKDWGYPGRICERILSPDGMNPLDRHRRPVKGFDNIILGQALPIWTDKGGDWTKGKKVICSQNPTGSKWKHRATQLQAWATLKRKKKKKDSDNGTATDPEVKDNGAIARA